MENNIAEYLSGNFAAKEAMRFFKSPDAGEAAEERTRSCRGADRTQATNGCELAVMTACRLPAQRWAWQDRFYEPVKNVCRKHGSNCVQNRRRLGQFPINRAYL